MNRFRALERPGLLNRSSDESVRMRMCLCAQLLVYVRVLDLLNVQVTVLLFLLIDA